MAFSKEEVNKRIRYVVSLSKEIPWYARKYKELGINPDEIRKPEDLLKAYEKGLYTTPADLPELVYYKHPEAKGPFYTSGTTGKPKEIWLNPDDNNWLIPQWLKGFNASFSKKDKVLVCLPNPPAISSYMVNSALIFGGYSFEHAPTQEIGSDVKKFIEFHKRAKPSTLISLTSFAYRLPLQLEGIGISAQALEIKSIAFGGEPSTLERRKKVGEEFNCNVFDWYPSSENGLIAYEDKAFSSEYRITMPEHVVFLVRNGNAVSEGEVGDVIVSNLIGFDVSKPALILLNYKIGDFAKCLEMDGEISLYVSDIRREAAYLAGAKLNPTEVEAIVDGLNAFKALLTGEYCIINYTDVDRRAVAEIRLEARKPLTHEQKEKIAAETRQKIYETNVPVYHLVEIIKDAKLTINITEPGELYKGYEQHVKPGKPKRLITIS